MFQKTRVFNTSWEAEKREIKKFLIVKGYEDLIALCVSLFSYKLLPFFSFLRGFFTILLVKHFSVEQKQKLGGAVKKVF